MCLRGMPRAVRLLLAALILLTPVCVGVFVYMRATDARTVTLEPVRMPFAASTVLASTDDQLLVGENGFIYAYAKTGEKIWEYALDTQDVEVSAAADKVAVWSERSMRVLGTDGTLVFTGSLPEGIRAVRCGLTMFAALGADNTINVFNAKDGQTIDTIQQAGVTVLDFGFYSQNDLLWVLSLETSGTAPISHVSTFQPSRLMTSGNNFSDEVVYRALYHKNEIALVGTRQLRLNNDSGSADKFTEVFVYGWELLDGRVARDKLTLLFAPAAQIEAGRVTDARLYYGQDKNDWMELTLPPNTFTAVVGERAVYAISQTAITAMPYSGEARTYPLSLSIDGVSAVLSGGALAVRRGDEVYLITLP